MFGAVHDNAIDDDDSDYAVDDDDTVTMMTHGAAMPVAANDEDAVVACDPTSAAILNGGLARFYSNF